MSVFEWHIKGWDFFFLWRRGGGRGRGRMKIFPSQTFFLCKQFFFPVAPSRIKFLSCLQTIYLGVLLLQKKKKSGGILSKCQKCCISKILSRNVFKYFCLETNLLTGCFYLAGKLGKTERWLQMHPLLQRNQYGDQSRRRKRDEIIRTAGSCQDLFN